MYDDDPNNVKVKVCEVCGEEGTDIQACRMCGVNFCSECGYPKKHLCFDCGDEIDESYEDEVDETFEESTDFAEE